MSSPPRATRRAALVGTVGTALGGALAPLTLAGCDTDDLRPHDPQPTTAASASASRGASGRTPDEALVDQVAAGLAGAVAVVRRARSSPGLRPVLGSLLRAHRGHLAALRTEPAAPATPTQTPTPAPAPTAADALATVRTTELALQEQLVAAAGRAESGALAALLASMSASVAQHLAVLAAEPSP